MANRYIYQRTGGPLVTWDHASGRPPGQARGADTVSLGSLGGSTLENIMFDGRPLPKPGLGVVVDEERVLEASRNAPDWRNPLWRHADGSVAEW